MASTLFSLLLLLHPFQYWGSNPRLCAYQASTHYSPPLFVWNSHMVIIYIYGRVSMVFQLFSKCLFVLCIIDFGLFLKEWEKVCLLKFSGGKPHWAPHFQLVMKFHCLKTMVLRSHMIISYLCRASGSHMLRQKSRVLQLLNWWPIAWVSPARGLIGPWGCIELQWIVKRLRRNTWWRLSGMSLRQ